jgi:hypothetical protein
MTPGMLDSEMVEDTAKTLNEAIKDKVYVYFIINNRAGGNAPDRRPASFTEAAEVALTLGSAAHPFP